MTIYSGPVFDMAAKQFGVIADYLEIPIDQRDRLLLPKRSVTISCPIRRDDGTIAVFDHPYFAVTDKDGNFTIKDVPAGKYTITALHRKAAAAGVDQEIEVKADGAKADFTLEVK